MSDYQSIENFFKSVDEHEIPQNGQWLNSQVHAKNILAWTHIKMVREGGLEPPRPLRTLEPESSESANSTTRANFAAITKRCLKY